MDVDAYMAERIPLVDAAIEARFAELTRGPEPLPANLLGAMRHLLFPGGKRLRPVFALAAAEAIGGPAAVALPLGVAVEMIHTYSLIHDDLPCMDDDALRRGRPTVHVAYGEATAVLAGDALLTEAFGVLAAMENARSAGDAEARIFAIGRLAAAAGAQGLVGGQVDDLAFEAGAAFSSAEGSPDSTEGSPDSEEGSPDSEEGSPHSAGGRPEVAANARYGTNHAWLASIHARKTAALFQASIVGGAALAGATPAQRNQLEEFGRDVGIGFQIADDVLDVGSDEAASILRLEGIDDARRGAEGLLDRALARIEGWGEVAEPLRVLARFAVRRKR